jgi:hypothetical protein
LPPRAELSIQHPGFTRHCNSDVSRQGGSTA